MWNTPAVTFLVQQPSGVHVTIRSYIHDQHVNQFLVRIRVHPITSNASRLLKGFAITHENYKQAWETLLNLYDNQRELAFSQCKKFSLKNVKPTSKSIWAMIDVCNEVLRNFKTLGLECNQLVELLLVFSLQDKLEDSSKVKWELTLEDKNFPSLNKFLPFLEKQARSLQGIKITPFNEKSNKVSHKPYSL
ncbi:uncharacterized protein TNCV_111671 [Trichonephila clavipes]|nr:uncharacterized protein TNCV_111671 [Trichonephila clavipes]